MATKVLMPQLGESVIEGTLTKWLKAPGENVDEYDPLVEVNTDKVDTEVPSPAAGVLLQILVPEGTTVQAGELLAWIGQPGEKPEGVEVGAGKTETITPIKPEPIPAAQPASELNTAATEQSQDISPAIRTGRDRKLGFISPVVAKIASENAIDLYQVPGTGQDGRITKKDIERYLEKQPSQQAPAAPPSRDFLSTGTTVGLAQASQASAPVSTAQPGELITLSPLRKLVAEHMVRSKHTSPHVTTIMEADLSRVVAHRQANKDEYSRDGINLTFTAYFIAAAVAALKEYPIVNSSFTEDGIRIHQSINIGMATSLGEAGLIVPVIKNADGLSLLGIARAVNDLANRARSRQLVPDEVQGGTFTLTNHGISKSLFATPIINQPQCAILGTGAIQKRPIVISDEVLGDVIAIRTMVYLGLTFDHRILDGAIADYFLGKVVEALENWA
jgi:2-oxoisovalerate dehydrogenase E2 component (dihydrolipoyl transacylase)